MVFEDVLETIINKRKFAVEDYCPAVKLIELGDVLIFYVKSEGAKRFGGKVAGGLQGALLMERRRRATHAEQDRR